MFGATWSPPPGLDSSLKGLEVEGDSAGESGEDDDDHDRGSDQDERRRCEFDGSQRLCFSECLHANSVGAGVGPDYWGIPPTNPETPKALSGVADTPWIPPEMKEVVIVTFRCDRADR